VPGLKALCGEALGLCVVASGADGCTGVFSLVEVDPSFHPGEVLVADRMNGEALGREVGAVRRIRGRRGGMSNLVGLRVVTVR
jgi:hypothetical protein